MQECAAPGVLMEWRGVVGAAGVRLAVTLWRRAGALPAALLAASVAGCSTIPSTEPNALAGQATVAFESIDGPPPAVFRTLVASLRQEAEARRIAFVSREGPATYRVRGYVSAQVARGQTKFAWVWDVYDADKRRAVRMAGQVPASRHPGDAWAAADERVLRQIARDGMERMAAFLNADKAWPPAPSEQDGQAVASVRDDDPKIAGSFRIVSADRRTKQEAGRAAGPAAVNLRRQRMTASGQTRSGGAARAPTLALAGDR
jgi:hypothetical protein